jgi:hypothetical protein
MAKRVASIATFTPTAQADGTLTTQTFFVGGGYSGTASSIDIMSISDIVQAGQATSSAFNAMCLTRTSTLGVSPTALALPNSDGFVKTGSPAYSNAPTWYWAATTTQPARAPVTTISRLQIGFNAFGGTFRLAFAPGNEWMSVGAAGSTNGVASQSENVFSCQNSGGTTSGAQSLSVTYEMI